MLIFILALKELRKSNQQRFLLTRKLLSSRCSHGKICWCLRTMRTAFHSGTCLLLSQRCISVSGVSESNGGQQQPELPGCNPKNTEPQPGGHTVLNMISFCLLNGWRLLQEHAVFVCTPTRGRRMLIIRYWRNWLEISDVCQPPYSPRIFSRNAWECFLAILVLPYHLPPTPPPQKKIKKKCSC